MKTVLFGLIAAAAVAAPVYAATSYDFNYLAQGGSSGVEYGSGIITLSAFDDGYATVLSIAGEANGSIITGLSRYAGANNMVFDRGPLVDQGGVSIATASGVDFNLYTFDGVYKVLSSSTTHNTWDSDASKIESLSFSPAVAAAPEPQTWFLLVFGIAASGLTLRRSKLRDSRFAGATPGFGADA